MTVSMNDGDTLITDLGIDHQLVWNVHGWNNVITTVL